MKTQKKFRYEILMLINMLFMAFWFNGYRYFMINTLVSWWMREHFEVILSRFFSFPINWYARFDWMNANLLCWLNGLWGDWNIAKLLLMKVLFLNGGGSQKNFSPSKIYFSWTNFSRNNFQEDKCLCFPHFWSQNVDISHNLKLY